MFTSNVSQSSQFVKTRDGKLVENLILDKGVWKKYFLFHEGCSSLAHGGFT